MSLFLGVAAYCASYLTRKIVTTVADDQIQGFTREVQPKLRNAFRAKIGHQTSTPETNHDIQRALAMAFVKAANRWMESLQSALVIPELERDGTDLEAFCARVVEYLNALGTAARDRKSEFVDSAPAALVNSLIDLVPESLSNHDDLAYMTRQLTQVFENFIKAREAQELPEYAQAKLFDKVDEGSDYVKFGHEVFKAFVEILKSPDYPEATIAFELQVFGELRKELVALTEKFKEFGGTFDDAMQAIKDTQFDIAQIGHAAFQALQNQGEILKRQSIDIAVIRQHIEEGLKDRNSLLLDRQVAHTSDQPASFVSMQFECRGTVFVGRSSELNDLKAFLDADERLLWWQVSGAGGQGKSRLGLELLDGLGANWHAGFLDWYTLKKTDWSTLNFPQNTLIIIDYIAAPGKATQFKQAIKTLTLRQDGENDATRLTANLRFLILEREGYDAIDPLGRGTASWYGQIPPKERARMDRTLYAPQSLCLQELGEAEMISIANSWRKENSRGKLGELTVDQEQKLLSLMLGEASSTSDLETRSKAWRPLFAMMIGEHLDHFDENAAGDRQIYDILAQSFKAEQDDYWQDPDRRSLMPPQGAQNIACLATMIGTYDHEIDMPKLEEVAPSDAHPNLFYGPFEEDDTFQKASMALGYHTNPIKDCGTVRPLFGRQPDLLGEFFVLWCLGRNLNRTGLTTVKKRALRLVSDGHNIAPRELSEFVQRINQDFPNKDVSIKITQAYGEVNDPQVKRSRGFSVKPSKKVLFD